MSDSTQHKPPSTGFAARLGTRARGHASEAMTVPYRPDRPANPATAPESALAEYGVFEDLVNLQSGSESTDENFADDRSDGLRAPLHQELVNRSARTQEDSRHPDRILDRSPRPLKDAQSDRAKTPTPQIQNIHIIERIQERVTRPEHPLAAPTRSEQDMSSSIPSLATHVETTTILPRSGAHTDAINPTKGRALPNLDSVSADHAQTKTSAELRTQAPPRRPSLDAPEPLMPVSIQPATGAPIPPEDPSPPLRSQLRPRERSAIAEDIHLAVLAESSASPVIRIGSITVEVIEVAKRPEPRRVVQPCPLHGEPSTSSKTGSNNRISRPLRTFGLRQL